MMVWVVLCGSNIEELEKRDTWGYYRKNDE